MTEQELLVDCLRRLNRLGIPYMLTGSMASNFWGIPRTTHDLDFVVRFPPEAVVAIDQRSALKVNFWMLRSDEFEQVMFERRFRVTLFGETAWVSTAEDVILHKLYWNALTPSERQLGDAAGIFAVQAENLDRAYLSRWGSILGVAQTLEDLLAGKIRPKST